MSRPSGSRAQPKDMYWFAHGGLESSADKCIMQKSTHGETEEESGDSNPSSLKSAPERRVFEDQKPAVKDTTDGAGNYSLPSLERDDRLHASDKRIAVEERKKQLWEAEQEKNDAVLKKRLERDAALEARRNAQRSNISFAFGSSVPRNIDSLQGDGDKVTRQPNSSGLAQKEENHEIYQERQSISPLNHFSINDISPRSHSSQSNAYSERKTVSPPCWLVGSGALIGEDTMSRSMTSAVAPRGRRKNDLMPTVPYERAIAPKTTPTSSTRKRSVSMTRLDQLAQPRKHYLEATKANSSSGGGASNTKDNVRSPTRPLSSASEQSGGSGKRAIHRVRSSPRKPRPVSIAGTVPDSKKSEPIKKAPAKKTIVGEIKKAVQSTVKLAISKPEKPKPIEKTKVSPPKASSTPKPIKQSAKPASATRASTPKTTAAKKSPTNKKKDDILVSVPPEVAKNKVEDPEKLSPSSPASPTPDTVAAENEKNSGKKIISEEEAKAALAEKRRLAREQAEREIELERQRQEELKQLEEERLRQEEEEQKRMEEEQLRLLEEHRRQEDEKLKKAIEEQERKEEEEKTRREEEQRQKAEQERKSHEEAEKQRIELEEKLRKEEEERAERKKRLEKIMSRTRGKTSGTSPSGSVSSSDQLDSGDNQQEGFSSGANSLDSNESNELPSEPTSNEDTKAQTEILSSANSLEANPTFEIVSETESLNSNDLMMPVSETASQDNSLVIVEDKEVELTADVAVEEPISKADIVENESHNSQISSDQVNQHFDFVENEFSNSQISSNQVNQQCDGVENESSNNQIDSDQVIQHFDKAENESSNSQNLGDTSPVNQLFDQEKVISEGIIEVNTINVENTDFVMQTQVISENVLNENQNVGAEEIMHGVEVHDGDQSGMHEDDDQSVKLDSSNSHGQSLLVEDSEINNEFYKDLSSCVEQDNELNENTGEEYVVQSDVSALHTEGFSHSEMKNIVSEFETIDYEDSDKFNNFSSSDIKLPDPIYETSEDGSLSSEKQHPDFSTFNMNNHESNVASDDVFTEQVDREMLFKEQSHLQVDQQSEYFQGNFPTEDSMFKNDNTEPILNYSDNNDFGFDKSACFPSNAELNVQSSEEKIYSLQDKESCFDQSTDSVEKVSNPFCEEIDNKENIEHHPFSDAAISSNPFSSNNISFKEYDTHPEKENFHIQSAVQDNITTVAAESRTSANESNYEVFPSTLENSNFNQFQDNKFDAIQQNSFFTSEQTNNFETSALRSSEVEDLSNLTFVKAEGSENCIGIISSIDHDQMINDFPKTDLLNEHLKPNFQCASMTDSEESSLDSNLSQVMTVEMNDNEVQGLNNGTDVPKALNGISKGQPELISQNTYNSDSISKPNGNHFPSTDIYSNGHRVESPEHLSEETGRFSAYVPLEGKDISSVEHCRSNMFDNVDAFGKVSPDSFLAKGTSNQIPGNPFLLQDDQKQVLMTPDFFN